MDTLSWSAHSAVTYVYGNGRIDRAKHLQGRIDTILEKGPAVIHGGVWRNDGVGSPGPDFNAKENTRLTHSRSFRPHDQP